MHETYHLIYVSSSLNSFSEESIVELLAKARKFNRKLNVSGILLYDKEVFFQILEGEKNVVEELFTHILKDTRHDKVVKIIWERIPEKNFADWSMGYSALSTSELKKNEGMNDFFKDQSCLLDIDAGRSLKLLKAFASGRWRLA